ncbi:MAG: indole-3-glycerol phosphate synthase TrpC [Zetaproteobacteria bacterium]|nr:MAG: indole-3-glycerol phosphate synthase TrpC [Zetaproteobacteria bacterium]
MADILQTIYAHKRKELAALKRRTPLSELEARLPQAAPYSLREALARKIDEEGVAFIAEIKKASPSKGVIREDFDPQAIARAYRAHGAAALSVLTDIRFFQGHPDYVRLARREAPDLPILRKDFLFDPYQVVEARAIGADAVLVILAMVDDHCARDLLSAARALGMDALVEVHDEAEVERALRLGAELIGINNRDLRSFSVSLETTARLAPLARSQGALVVAESGIGTRADVQWLVEHAGVRAFLVGESLMRAPDPGRALATLRGVER